jgi:hypothetical protein
MSKHTLGPWRLVDKANADKDRDAVQSVDGLWVAQVIGGFPNVTREANGLLLAAAPDLLSVLKELQECSGYWSDYDVPLGIVGRIRAAIAKAEGV